MFKPTVGRDKERQHLERWHAKQGILVHGPPGVGESHLVRMWASEHDIPVFHIIHSDSDPLVTLATHLGLSLEGASSDHTAQCVAQALQISNTTQIVIDGGSIGSTALTRWTHLRQAAPWLGIVLCTRTLPPIQEDFWMTLAIGPLSLPDAQTLLTQRLARQRRTLSPEDQERILTTLDTLPLTIELVAHLCHRFSPQELLERLAHELETWDNQDHSLQQTLEESWEAWSDAQRALATQLCWFPGPFTTEQAEQLCTWEQGPLWRQLDDLAHNGALSSLPDARCLMSATIRLFLRGKTSSTDPLQEAMHANIAQMAHTFYKSYMGLSTLEARKHLFQQLPMFVAMSQELPEHPSSLAPLCMIQGIGVAASLVPLETFLETSARALATLQETDDAHTIVTLQLQRVVLQRNLMGTAHVREMLATAEQLATRFDMWGPLSQMARLRAHTYTVSLDDTRALDAHKKSVTLARKAKNPLILVRALQSLAWFYAHTNQHSKSLEAGQQALEICNTAQDSVRAASCRRRLARTLCLQGFLDEATHHLDSAEPYLHLLPGLKVYFQENRNLIHLQREELSTAQDTLDEIITSHRAFGRDFAVAGWLRFRSSLCAQREDPESARASLLEALNLHDKLGDTLEVRRDLTLLSLLSHHCGQEHTAQGYLERASNLEVQEPSAASQALYLLACTRAGQDISDIPLPQSKEDAPLLSILSQNTCNRENVMSWVQERPERFEGRWALAMMASTKQTHEGLVVDMERQQVFLPWKKDPIDLSRRGPMRRVLFAMIRQHESRESLSIWDAFDAGWPGEHAEHEQMVHRVRVVISRLRKLGLKDHIRTAEQGYTWIP